MSDYCIITDTSSELSLARCAELGIRRLTLNSTFGQEDWPDHDDLIGFYQTISSKNIPTTSGLNYQEFFNVADQVLASGKDVIFLGLSGALSSASVSVRSMVQEDLSEKYPGHRIVCLETFCVSGGLEYLVTEAVERQQMGFSLDQLIEYVEKTRGSIAHHFTSDDLLYYFEGGRISRLKYIFGKALDKKPVMHVNDAGELEPLDSVSGTDEAIRNIAKKIVDTITKKDGRIIISHANCPEKAQLLYDLLHKALPEAKIEIRNIGPTIGSHAGPTSLAVFCEATQR